MSWQFNFSTLRLLTFRLFTKPSSLTRENIPELDALLFPG